MSDRKWYEVTVTKVEVYVIEVEDGQDPYDEVTMSSTRDFSTMMEAEAIELKTEEEIEQAKRHADEVFQST